LGNHGDIFGISITITILHPKIGLPQLSRGVYNNGTGNGNALPWVPYKGLSGLYRKTPA
jgi:hypothetical protein